MRALTRLLVPLTLGLAVLATGTLVRALDPGALTIVRERTFDLYQRVDPPHLGPDVPVRIIDIDDPSLSAFGQWPWPRTLLADLVTRLHEAGAAVVAFDMIFPEPDRSSPAQALRGLTLRDLELPDQAAANLSAALDDLLDHDTVFAQALAAGPSVLGIAIADTDVNAGETFAPLGGLALLGPSAETRLTQAGGTIGNVEILEKAVLGLGGIHVSARDDDAVVRRIPALTQLPDAVLPSLFVETLRVAQGAQSVIVRTNPDPGAPDTGIPQDLRIGAFTVPLTSDGAYRVRYGTLNRDLTIPAASVLSETGSHDALADRLGGTIVLIGTSAPGLFDLRASPLGTIIPGVEMHAQAIANIVTQTHVTRPDWTLGLELMMGLIAGLVVIAAALTLRPLPASLIAAAAILALGTASWLAFERHLLLLDASYPVALTLATFGAVTIPILIGTDRRQRFIRNAFTHYLAEPVLARLERDPQALTLAGERRVMSVLFMDVRGFTARSEHMPPAEAVALLNTLLDPLSEAVLAEEGTIDKFMGDGLMAFWNAPLDQPDHAARAVRAALAMIAAIEAINAGAPQASAPQAGEPLAIGIGLHTGEGFVGNMGSRRRFAYSAIGDSVNLAARVETLTATLGEPLLITEATWKAACASDPALGERFAPAGDHTVKGRSQPVTVYALTENPA